MAEKRPLADEEPPSAAAGARARTSSGDSSSSSGSSRTRPQNGDVAVDVERISGGVSVTIPGDDDDVEFRGHPLASVEVGDDARPADGSGGKSREAVGMSPLSVLSNWRWIGAKELHYLVTNRRPPPPPRSQPAPSAAADEQVARPSSAGSVSAQAAAAEREDEEEKGAFVRVVTDGGGDRRAPDGGGGGEGGRQTMAHILLPTTSADSPLRSDPRRAPGGNSDEMSKDEELLLRAAAAARRGGKKRNMSTAADGEVGKGDAARLHADAQADAADDGGRAAGAADGGGDDDDENEALCRVCHMSTASARKDDVLDLGCACKMDMGRAHRDCAETWFQVRGNRKCEICGEIARNVVLSSGAGDAPSDDGQERSTSDATVTIVTVHRPIFSACWQDRPIRNFVLVFLVAAFLVPWLFRFVYYS